MFKAVWWFSLVIQFHFRTISSIGILLKMTYLIMTTIIWYYRYWRLHLILPTICGFFLFQCSLINLCLFVNRMELHQGRLYLVSFLRRLLCSCHQHSTQLLVKMPRPKTKNKHARLRDWNKCAINETSILFTKAVEISGSDKKFTRPIILEVPLATACPVLSFCIAKTISSQNCEVFYSVWSLQ